MFILGLNEFLRNIKRNILTVLQLILVYVLAIFTLSAYVEQLSLYRGVSGFLDDTGMFVDGKAAYNEELESMLTKVESIERVYYCSLHKGSDKESYYRLVSWDRDVVKYKVPLIKGKWCDSGSAEDGVIRIVVSSNNPFMWKVGETYTFNESSGELKFKVTGMYDARELIFGLGGSAILMESSYLNFYYREFDGNNQFIFIASYEDMEREMVYPEFENLTIDFEDDITEEEYNNNWNILSTKYGLDNEAEIRSTEETYELSNRMLQIKLLPIGIIFLVAIIFSIISVFTSSAVTVMYEKKNYGIYFISGNNWGNTVKLSLIHWSIASVTAIIISSFICVMIKLSGRFTQFALSFTGYHVLGIIAITLILLLMAVLLPYRMLRKMQPVNVLKNNG